MALRVRRVRVLGGRAEGWAAGFEVLVGRREVAEFKRRWPVSGLGKGPYWFAYAANGDLVDAGGPRGSSTPDGPAIVAMSHDAYRYGECKMARRRNCRRVFEKGE